MHFQLFQLSLKNIKEKNNLYGKRMLSLEYMGFDLYMYTYEDINNWMSYKEAWF